MKLYDPKLLAALEVIELTGWKLEYLTRERQFLVEQINEAKIRLAAYITQQWMDDSHDERSLNKALSEEGSTGIVINGHGGWNRFAIRGDGTVEMSSHHASKAAMAKAQEISFLMY